MRVHEGVAAFEGDLVLDQASRLLAEAEAALALGARVFDFSGVGHMDSSALSLMLSLRRRAAGGSIEFRSVPESLNSLAKLYGIADQL